MQFPKLTPLQSRFAASLAASLLLVILYLILSNPHFAYATDVDSIIQKDHNHPLSLQKIIHEDDFEDLDSDHESKHVLYEPEFAGLGRSIIGRADAQVPQTLSNNVPGKLNINPGDVQYWTFPKTSLSAPLSSATPVIPPNHDKRETAPRTGYPENGARNAELKRRQNLDIRVHVTLNTCDQPSAAPGTTPPQLRFFISQSNHNPGPNANDMSVNEVPVNGGFSYYTNPTSTDLYLGIAAPPGSSGLTGEYNYEITASIDAPYAFYEGYTNLYLVDSDSKAALFVSNNLTNGSNSSSASYTEWMDSPPPFSVFVHNQNDPSILGLEQSYCGLKNKAQIQGGITDLANVEVGMTTIGGGNPKQQFYVQGLNRSSSYHAFMALNTNYTTPGSGNVGGGGTVWNVTNFNTMSDENCQVIYNLSFCPQVSYAVPSNYSTNASTLAQWYDSNANILFQNFSYSLQQIPCETTSSAQYSLAVTCADCNASYHQWLCAVTIPRCADFTSTAPYLLPRNSNSSFLNPSIIPQSVLSDPVFSHQNKSALYFNSSRNTAIDQQIAPGPYKELLPCRDLCYGLVQSCPASLGFACPLQGKGLEHSYGDMSTGCSIPGAIWGVNGASGLRPVVWAGYLVFVAVLFYNLGS